MPQKRNPDTAELLRGKTSRALGNLMHLLSLLKAQPLAYNRDLQEDKPPLFDSARTTLLSLNLVSGILASLRVNEKKTAESCERGFLLATELADYLSRKGLAFREAHRMVAQIIQHLRSQKEKKQNIQSLSLDQLKLFSPLFEADVYPFLSLHQAAAQRNSYGGTGKKALATQIKNLRSLLR
jgi:argininosuccinate lyase